MIIDTAICETALDVSQLPELPAECGARAIFTGCVRNHDRGRAVTHLVYEAHPQAEVYLAQAVKDAIARCQPTMRPTTARAENSEQTDLAAGRSEQTTPVEPQVQVYAHHRVGQLAVGEIALMVAVDTAHRALAFSLVAEIVDQIKAQVPIWKEQFYPDGSSDWSECP